MLSLGVHVWNGVLCTAPAESWNWTRIRARPAQAGALYRNTSGFAVGDTTGWPAVTRDRNWNSDDVVDSSPVSRLRADTSISWTPSCVAAVQSSLFTGP